MSSERYHRRDFVHALVLGASAATLADPPAAADEKEGKGESKTEVDARMDLVLARFGERLDDDARKSVRAEVESIVHRAELLRRFSLENGDGPFPVFTPYRGPLAP